MEDIKEILTFAVFFGIVGLGVGLVGSANLPAPAQIATTLLCGVVGAIVGLVLSIFF